MNNEQFIESIAPSAVTFYRGHKISAALIIAQACLESGYGTAAPGNNLFGIKADSSWTGPTVTVPTQEYVNGKEVTIKAKFRAYATLGDSLIDHGSFLLNNSNYRNLVGADYQTACNEIAKVDHYATDPTYGTQLLDIITQYGLAKYDVLPAPPKITPMKVFVQDRPMKAIAVNNDTYVIWTALNMLGTPYKKLNDSGLFQINGKNVQGVIYNDETYFLYEDLYPGIKYEKVWSFTK